MTYNGRDAFRLTDGKTEAIVVPALGRVMRFAFTGEANVLWNAPVSRTFPPGDWQNWGGDKTWPAPQTLWPAMIGREWPPDSTWDGAPHVAQLLEKASLRMSSGTASGIGSRVIREFSYNQHGEFVINQTIEKSAGPPLFMSIWSVTQINPPDAIFMPISTESAYKGNFHWIVRPKNKVSVDQVSPGLLQVSPDVRGSFKIGVDAPVVSLASVKDGVAFVERASEKNGEYPDGAIGSGFPIELWNNGDPGHSTMSSRSSHRLSHTPSAPGVNMKFAGVFTNFRTQISRNRRQRSRLKVCYTPTKEDCPSENHNAI